MTKYVEIDIEKLFHFLETNINQDPRLHSMLSMLLKHKEYDPTDTFIITLNSMAEVIKTQNKMVVDIMQNMPVTLFRGK